MKRTELKRRIPLRSRTAFAPVRSSLKRAALRQQSQKRSGEQAVRSRAERNLGRVNGVGDCARCGRCGPVNGHERLGRSQGGDPTKPDCLLCVPCNQICEDFPEWAALYGWKISKKHPRSDLLAPNEAFDIRGEVFTFPVATA